MTTSIIEKDLLFVSKKCEHCNGLLHVIQNFKDIFNFVVIEVDIGKFIIPKWVDRVPLLYRLSDNGAILSDDNLIKFIQSMILSAADDKKEIVQNSSGTDMDQSEIAPYDIGKQRNMSYSETFSFIEDAYSDSTANTTGNSNNHKDKVYTFLDDRNLSLTMQQHHNNSTSNSTETNNNSGNKFDCTAFEKFKQERAQDMAIQIARNGVCGASPVR